MISLGRGDTTTLMNTLSVLLRGLKSGSSGRISGRHQLLERFLNLKSSTSLRKRSSKPVMVILEDDSGVKCTVAEY